VEPDFCPFHVIRALAFSIIRINITETELTELSNGKLKAHPLSPWRWEYEGALGEL
jgi:hypothetical protein